MILILYKNSLSYKNIPRRWFQINWTRKSTDLLKTMINANVTLPFANLQSKIKNKNKNKHKNKTLNFKRSRPTHSPPTTPLSVGEKLGPFSALHLFHRVITQLIFQITLLTFWSISTTLVLFFFCRSDHQIYTYQMIWHMAAT